MSAFPTYRGELPALLDPRNPQHYLLLLEWIFFRPNALKAYTHQAAPALYRRGLRFDLLGLQAWQLPAYRRLYLMLPGVFALLVALVELPISLLIAWFIRLPFNWPGYLLGIGGGIMVALLLGMAFQSAFGFVSGIAGTVTFGLSLSMTASVALGITQGWPTFIVLGLTWGLAFSVTFGAARYIAGGVVLGCAVGVIGGASLGLWNLGQTTILSRVIVSLAGAVLGLITFGVGVFRLPLYAFEVAFAWFSPAAPHQHPLLWDGLNVLPLPRARQALTRLLECDPQTGVWAILQATYNPFQRWVGQAVLQAYLHQHPAPLHFLYSLLANPDLDTYLPFPTSPGDWDEFPSARRVLLGELDRRNVTYGREWTYFMPERLVWALTWLWCDRRVTPLTRCAGMLYDLLDEKQTESTADFDLARYAEIYTALTDYPGGAEIAATCTLFVEFLACRHVLELPNRARLLKTAELTFADPVRPAVLAALRALAQVGAEIAVYRDATSRVNQLAALARATDGVDALAETIAAGVLPPEQYLLRRIIRQWRRLVSEAGGVAGRVEVSGPVANPYVAGNPVIGSLFVGREDILRRLEELWRGLGQWPSVVLYGHRRMGKSSILHNLGARFGATTLIVDFNMQRVGLVSSTGELLYNLALALYDVTALETLDEPEEQRFLQSNPYTPFDRFLKRLAAVRGERRFIVTVDEFELLEQGITAGKLEAQVLDFWRGVIQTYPWFVMAFAGLHTLQEMIHDYWHPLFGSVTGIPVSFLSQGATRRLITQPTLDFSLDYTPAALDRIWELTSGQPYLVQLIGHGLVSRFNRQAFEEGVERERGFDGDDVDAVITAADFYRDGDAYFTGVWRQAETTAPTGQPAVLRALAASADAVPPNVLADRIGMDRTATAATLTTLQRHDVVASTPEGGWRFTVELLRRWVARPNVNSI